MTERVIDASAIALALTHKGEVADQLRTRLRHTQCHAPHMVDAELGNVLRKQERAGTITPHQARTALHATRGLVHYRYPHLDQLADMAWSWRHNLSFYDALYVALATRLNLPLLTSDQRIANAPHLTCDIDLV